MKLYKTLIRVGIIGTTLPFLILLKDINWDILPFSQSLFYESTAVLVGGICGLIGATLLMWQLILGVRKVMALFSNDLVWMNGVHKTLGKYGVLLIFIHILLSTYGYVKNLLWLFLPDLSTDLEKSVTYGRLALLGILIIWVTSVFLRGKVKYRPWLYLHYLSYPILFFTYLHTVQIGTILQSYVFVRALWYLSAIIFGALVIYRVSIWSGITSSIYKITKIEYISADIFVITLYGMGKKLEPKVGQYLYLQLHRFGEAHPFTVFSFDNTKGVLKFAIKREGIFTKKLQALKVGSDLLVEGPYGIFTSEAQGETPKVILAGGVGITPFLELVNKYGNENTYFFNCNRKLSEALMRSELKEILGDNYFDFITQEQNDEQNVFNERVSFEKIKSLLVNKVDFSSIKYFICGSKPFIEGVEADLIKGGVEQRQIFSEKFYF